MNTAIQVAFAAAPYVVPVLVAILTVIVQSAQSKTPINKRELASKIVQTSVSAVEQMASEQLNGPGKKQLAIEFVEKQLQHYGIKVSASEINTLIEEAVFALNTVKRADASAVVPVPLSEPTK